MSELSQCLNGTSDYCHADKVATLYGILEHLGNNPEWQLCVLHIIQKGVEAKIKEKSDLLKSLLAQTNPNL